jgi:TRAP-type mannitol/chloroaromatic compound transport system permease large subunit
VLVLEIDELTVETELLRLVIEAVVGSALMAVPTLLKPEVTADDRLETEEAVASGLVADVIAPSIVVTAPDTSDDVASGLVADVIAPSIVVTAPDTSDDVASGLVAEVMALVMAEVMAV